jgi:hypothetical protein
MVAPKAERARPASRDARIIFSFVPLLGDLSGRRSASAVCELLPNLLQRRRQPLADGDLGPGRVSTHDQIERAFGRRQPVGYPLTERPRLAVSWPRPPWGWGALGGDRGRALWPRAAQNSNSRSQTYYTLVKKGYRWWPLTFWFAWMHAKNDCHQGQDICFT